MRKETSWLSKSSKKKNALFFFGTNKLELWALFLIYISASFMAIYLVVCVPLQVSLYLDKFSGVCQPALHDCKLTFLQIICDHDLFVEMPGRDPSDRY